MVECQPFKLKVAGSNPARSTTPARRKPNALPKSEKSEGDVLAWLERNNSEFFKRRVKAECREIFGDTNVKVD